MIAARSSALLQRERSAAAEERDRARADHTGPLVHVELPALALRVIADQNTGLCRLFLRLFLDEDGLLSPANDAPCRIYLLLGDKCRFAVEVGIGEQTRSAAGVVQGVEV